MLNLRILVSDFCILRIIFGPLPAELVVTLTKSQYSKILMSNSINPYNITTIKGEGNNNYLPYGYTVANNTNVTTRNIQIK